MQPGPRTPRTHGCDRRRDSGQNGPLPELQPFRAVRYDPSRVDPAAVVAPPYDVIGPERRAALAASHPYNAVHLDLPEDEGSTDRYTVAGRLLHRWIDEGVLRQDDEPSLTVYRMEYQGIDGRERHTHGVIGAVRLHRPEEGVLLPHERTTARDASDRLHVLRSCQANLSPIWLLAPTPGLTAAAAAAGAPEATWTTADGTRHAVWRLQDPERIREIAALVAAAPLLIADGHHRYETALAYRDERRASDGAGPWDLTLAYIVELAPDELDILPIHRLLEGAPPLDRLLAACAAWFEVEPLASHVDEADLPARQVDAGALVLVSPDGRWLLRPRPERFVGLQALDSVRLDAALPDLGVRSVRYQHGVGHAIDAVRSGAADAAVLLRPATIDQIEAIAHGGERMPPKTTFFSPKPSTGAVFRLLT